MQGLRRRWTIRSADPIPGQDGPAGDLTGSAAVDAPRDIGAPRDTGDPSIEVCPLVARVLESRGLTDRAEIERFCHPKLTHLHDPSLLHDVDKAAARMLEALAADQKIVIYGDYDVDGITATAILYHLLKCLNPAARVCSYVPHRLDEGYGINADALRQLAADGAHLVVSVDCGVTAVEPAAVASELGLDLIITDHHNPPEETDQLPDALAIVHPGLPTEQGEYPFRELCGAGVAFKLAWRLATMSSGSQRVGAELQRTLLDLLPLAALGTIADVVPLLDENRVIASFGLRRIKETPLVGLRALIEASGLMDANIDAEKVGFVLGPRLNACGRMGHAAQAVRLLTDAPPDEAAEIAEELTRLNRQRQQTERTMVQQAMDMAEEAGMTGTDRRVIVLAHEDWHPGVVGIACSRLVDRFARPVILLQKQGDICRGSARSIEGYSIHQGLCECSDHLEAFGGHDFAAGLSLQTSQLEAFADALTTHANSMIRVEDLVPILPLDCDAALAELDYPTVKQLTTLAPFGRSNRRPKIRLTDVTLAQSRPLGSQGKHLDLRLRDPRANRAALRAVWWNAAEYSERLVAGMQLDVAVEPKLNAFNGRVSVEAEMLDAIITTRSDHQ